MKEGVLRTIAGALSAVLGVALVIASSYHMYVEEVKAVGQSLHAQELLHFAVEAKCEMDPSNDGQLIYLKNCPYNSKHSLEKIRSFAALQPLAEVGQGYFVCGQANPVEMKIPDGAKRGMRLTAPATVVLPDTCKGVVGAAAPIKNTSRSENVDAVSVIAIQGAGGMLVPVKMFSFSESIIDAGGLGGAMVIEGGTHSMDSLINDLHVPRFAPRELIIFLVFAGVFAVNVGVAEIPGHKIPQSCRVPQFQTCSVSLMSTIAIMVTSTLCCCLFGLAWSKYRVVLAVPLFVAAVTSMFLLVFVRYRCLYDGYEEEEEEEDRKSLLRSEDRRSSAGSLAMAD